MEPDSLTLLLTIASTAIVTSTARSIAAAATIAPVIRAVSCNNRGADPRSARLLESA